MAVLLLAAACRTGRNYPDPGGPRYAGANSAAPVPADAPVQPVRIVSFNVEFGERVDSAITLLATEPALRDADLILLQEMDAAGTRRVAEARSMAWVYYPAVFHLERQRDFGNAILSRWPIVEDSRIVLPYPALVARTRRIAAAATICVAGRPIRVYSTHLGTIVDISPDERRRQLRTVLADAAIHERVVIGGDLNDESVGELARDAGYAWPTEHGPRTTRLGRWDHIFTRGLVHPPGAASGTVLANRNASDHRPVWTVALVQRPENALNGQARSCDDPRP